MEYEYDVALSFAGEERDYVEKVAEFLSEYEVKFFYDDYDEIDLWGKDLYAHLDEIYRKKAKYCVMFLSQHYAAKAWPNHERASAQARALAQKEEYILPARFDDTEVPGIRPTVKYIDLRNKTPREFADIILSKLGNKETLNEQSKKSFRRPKVTRKTFNPYDEAQKFMDFISAELKQRCVALSQQGCSFSTFKRDGRNCFRIVCSGETRYSLDIWTGGISGDASLSFYGVDGVPSSSAGASNAFGELVWSSEHDQIVLDLHDLSFLDMFSGSRKYTKEEFVNTLWDKICDAIEIET